jgi:hypothetical protein
MPNFSIDYQQLENVIYKKAYRLSEVQDRLERVAFDVVRFSDQDDGANLWQINQADDGEYIVALYEEKPEDTAKTASPWEVMVSTASQTLSFFYKGEPITKLAFNQLGIPASEVGLAKKYLPKSLTENKSLVVKLLANLRDENRKQLLAKYPELA